MQQLLLVNPKPRGVKKMSKRKNRKSASPAQLAARKKFAAMARARGKAARSTKRRSTSKPTAKAIVMSNPRKRRVKRATARRSVSKYRRNPISLGGVKPVNMLKSAAIGAGGAIVVNAITDKLLPYLPDVMIKDNGIYLTRALGALGLAMLAHKAGASGPMVIQAAEGALTVALHGAFVNMADAQGLNLHGYTGAGQRVGAYFPPQQMAKALTGPNSFQAPMIRTSAPARNLRGFAF